MVSTTLSRIGIVIMVIVVAMPVVVMVALTLTTWVRRVYRINRVFGVILLGGLVGV
jgi:hypothetical protein